MAFSRLPTLGLVFAVSPVTRPGTCRGVEFGVKFEFSLDISGESDALVAVVLEAVVVVVAVVVPLLLALGDGGVKFIWEVTVDDDDVGAVPERTRAFDAGVGACGDTIALATCVATHVPTRSVPLT